MATRKLYWEDAYLKEFEAVAKQVIGEEVILDQTAFYATSGGQPNDLGSIFSEGREYKVLDVKEDSGEVVHKIAEPMHFREGSAVRGRIDWLRRYSLMRYHTALHVLCAVAENKYNAAWKGGMIYTDKAHVDFDLPSLNKELAAEIIADVNAAIQEGHAVNSKFLSQDEALADPALAKTEPGRELLGRLEKVRVVEIEDFDIQMDGGTHVRNTREIGNVVLAGFDNKGSRRKRVEIRTEYQAAMPSAR